MKDMMTAVVVPAAGRGTRFGSSENKIWAKIFGRAVLDWTLSAFQSHPEIDAIVLAGSHEDLPRLLQASSGFTKVAAVVEGGASRQESVGNGIAALPPECDLVLVHDAVRPAVSREVITRIVAAAGEYGAAVPGLPITDTVKRVKSGHVGSTLPREGLWTVQTPQGARLSILKDAYKQLGAEAAGLTDEASVLEAAGIPVRIVQGDESNIKITRPDDLERAEGILRAGKSPEEASDPATQRPNGPTTRTGIGYDVHPFAEGRPLWLGGVRIPHPRGLAGHSDADALIHAICDALLGAAGMGDIGVLFPDTDAAHKDRASIGFLREIRDRLESERWGIGNIDVSVLAEEPRLAPHRSEMIAVIADALEIDRDQVNIKATTSEKMGFVGRGEGIACWAISTITRNQS